ncbi:MAG: ATP-binding protein [Eubacterium sp.]|nr:ATP-binding protein [Eubacterium sp.]
MIQRKISNSIRDWFQDSGKHALLVSGARQVGKTFSIREALKDFGKDYLEVNLIEHPDAKPVFENSITVEDLMTGLSAVMAHSFIKGETIIFIDEAQELSDIVTKIKFWVDEGSFRYILSGSLLGIELKSLRSVPVGYLREIRMYPLDFEEFMIASGVVPETISEIKNCFETRRPIMDAVHEKIMQHFIRYLIVGGMPEAVWEYVNSYDINKVDTIQKNIIEQYKLDFTKYEQHTKKLMLVSVYDQIPSQLLKQNKRFNLSDIKKGLRFERVEDSFLWLSSAGVAIPVYNATEPRISLSQNKKSSLLKLYASDVGLLTCMYGKSLRNSMLTGKGIINQGGIYENAVAQQLNTHGYNTFFYNSHKIGELDFVIEYENSIIPIEIKSGKDYYVHSALSKVIDNEEYNVKEAIIFANCNLEKQGKKTYMPVYMSTFLQDTTILPVLNPII